MKTPRDLRSLWMKAAMLGATWASVEIILGSFLHNLRLPFVGALLASIGAALLVAGQRLWPERGLLWRAGIICALMKSISPSALIMGPMIGIASEGIVLDLLVRVVGTSAPALVIAAGLVTLLPFIQSIVNLLILYGFDVARLYVEVYAIAAKNLRIESLSPLDLIMLVALVHALLGAIAGSLGIAVASRTAHLPRTTGASSAAQGLLPPWEREAQGRYSFLQLTLHIALLAGGLLVIKGLPVWAGPVLVLAYGAWCLRRYPSIRRQFGRWKLWTQFVVVTALAGVVLKGVTAQGDGWQWSGLLLGVQMTMRAMFVITAFSAIAHELRNPVIIQWMLRRGLGNLTAALETGFQSLPVMAAGLGEEKQFFRHPVDSLARMLNIAVSRLAEREAATSRARVLLLVGNTGSGKTTLIDSIAAALRSRGVRIGGITAPGSWRDGKRSGFDVLDLASGQRRPLCATEGMEGAERIGPFVFSDAGLAFGREALSAERIAGCDVVVIDEVGPLELRGNGWAGCIGPVLDRAPVVVLTLRPGIEQEVAARWGLAGALRREITATHSEECVRVIVELLG